MGKKGYLKKMPYNYSWREATSQGLDFFLSFFACMFWNLRVFWNNENTLEIKYVGDNLIREKQLREVNVNKVQITNLKNLKDSN